MDQEKIQPVILSGGVGSRLWPLSEPHCPKQLLTLVGNQSLLQTTARRFNDATFFVPPMVIANQAHQHETTQQLHEAGITESKIILEPVGRNYLHS